MQNQLAVNRTPEFQRKKQAIHFALCTVLTQEEAAGAVNSWEQHVSASSSLFNGLHLFAHKICVTYGKGHRHVELAHAMRRALVIGGVEPASNDPSTMLIPVQTASPNETGEGLSGPMISTPEFESFQPLLLALLDKITKHNVILGTACREFLLSVVHNLPWSPAQQEQVINLINTGATTQIRPYRVGQLKALVHHLVVWMNDMLGIEITESFTRYAIGIVQPTEAGMAYAPGEFLSR
jgi:hypothetical protein